MHCINIKWVINFTKVLILLHLQVPFESAVNRVLEQLTTIAKGDYIAPSTEKKRLGAIVYAGVSLPIPEILSVLKDVSSFGPVNYDCILLQ